MNGVVDPNPPKLYTKSYTRDVSGQWAT